MALNNLKEAGTFYGRILHQFPDAPEGEMARQARNRLSNDNLHKTVDGNIRLDALMYMEGAISDFAKLPREELGKIVLEIATFGQDSLKINEPSVRYNLKSMPGDYSGLQLLSMMHVGIKLFDANADSGSGLDREYEVAKGMRSKQ